MTQFYGLTGRRAKTPTRTGVPGSLRLRHLFEAPEPATPLNEMETTTTPTFKGINTGEGGTGIQGAAPDTRTAKEKAVDSLAGYSLGTGFKDVLGPVADVTGNRLTVPGILGMKLGAAVNAPAHMTNALANIVNNASRNIPGYKKARSLADQAQERNKWGDDELAGNINNYMGAVEKDPAFSGLSPTDQTALQMSGTHVQGLDPGVEQEIGTIAAQTAQTRTGYDRAKAALSDLTGYGWAKDKLSGWTSALMDAVSPTPAYGLDTTPQNTGFMKQNLETGERKGSFGGFGTGIDDPSLGGGMATNPGDTGWNGDLADLDPADFSSIHDANRGNPWGGGSDTDNDGPSHAGSGPGGSGGGFAGHESMGL